MINWKVRIKNKAFWLAFIPALALLVTAIANVFGYKLELDGMTEKLVNVVYAVFSLLALLGVVTDPTTDGASDSKRALSYETPWKDEEGK